MFNDFVPIICLKCYQIPLISFSTPDELLINCSCGNKETISIDIYIDTVRKIKEKIKIINKCLIHGNMSFSYYCLDCQINICKLCRQSHAKHKKIDLTIPLNKKIFEIDLKALFICINKILMLIKKVFIGLLIKGLNIYKQDYLNFDEINKAINFITKFDLIYQKIIESIKYQLLFVGSVIYSYNKFGLNYTFFSNLFLFLYAHGLLGNLNPFEIEQLSNKIVSESEVLSSNLFSNLSSKDMKDQAEKFKDMIFNQEEPLELIFKDCSNCSMIDINNPFIKELQNILLDISNKRMNHGEIILFDSEKGKYIYYGEILDNKKNGYGRSYYSDRDKFEGQFKDDQANGYGIMYYSDGDKYEGQWEIGRLNGYGILHFRNGSKYEGEFRNNYYHGYGIFYYLNGDRYEGQWKYNYKDEYGTFYYFNGDKWEQNIYDEYGIYYNSYRKKHSILRNDKKKVRKIEQNFLCQIF